MDAFVVVLVGLLESIVTAFAFSFSFLSIQQLVILWPLLLQCVHTLPPLLLPLAPLLLLVPPLFPFSSFCLSLFLLLVGFALAKKAMASHSPDAQIRQASSANTWFVMPSTLSFASSVFARMVLRVESDLGRHIMMMPARYFLAMANPAVSKLCAVSQS